MTFNSESAALAGKKGGARRWADKPKETIRNAQIKISVTPAEREMITARAASGGISIAELMVRAVAVYDCQQTGTAAERGISEAELIASETKRRGTAAEG